MKPRVKNDSWCYTTSKRAAREKVKRLTNKRHRRDNKRIINGEVRGSPFCFIALSTSFYRYRSLVRPFDRIYQIYLLASLIDSLFMRSLKRAIKFRTQSGFVLLYSRRLQPIALLMKNSFVPKLFSMI